MEEIEKLNNEIHQLVEQVKEKRETIIKQKLKYLSQNEDDKSAHLTEEEWRILKDYLTKYGDCSSIKMQHLWKNEIDWDGIDIYRTIIRIGNKYIAIESGMDQGFELYSFDVSDKIEIETEENDRCITINGIDFLLGDYIGNLDNKEDIIAGKKELTKGLDIETLFSIEKQLEEKPKSQNDRINLDDYVYDLDSHEVIKDEEHKIDTDYIHSASLTYVIDNILRNTLIDTKANAKFNETDNICEIGKYEDMPGEEEIALVLNSVDKEILQAYFEKYPNDIPLFEEMRKKYPNIQSIDIKIEQSQDARQQFEDSLMREDVVEYYLSKTPEEIQQELGPQVSRMIGFEQKNSHHCYDLWEHTLRTVEGIKPDGLTEEQFKKIRVAAFFHDIGKPDVSTYNPKTEQQVFYGHALHSADVAKPVLESLGYDEEEIKQLCFYIAHHDDFISYKSKLAPFMKNHEFIRGIDTQTVAEKVIENKYDFEAMGYNKDEIRAIVYTLAHNKEPDFRTKDGPISIPVNIDEVKEKISSGKYNSNFDPRFKDYQMLLQLCKADAEAQSEVAERTLSTGKKVVDGSKAEKLENMTNIENEIPLAYKEATSLVQKIPQSIKKEAEKHTGYSFEEFIVETKDGFKRPKIVMGDGVSMSVQASAFHYCEPKKSGLQSYESYEVGAISEVIEQLRDYAEDYIDSDEELLHTVYPYVPAEVLSQIVMEHGGINKEATLHPEKKLEGYKEEKTEMQRKNEKAAELINQLLAQLGNIIEDNGNNQQK